MILIIDFGSQTTHLISRRINDIGIKTKIVLPDNAIKKIKVLKPQGIILSGGPASVYGKKPLLIDKKIFDLGIPILGICYGLELIGQLLGGKVSSGEKKEYGATEICLNEENKDQCLLLKNINKLRFKVWMSHFDQVIKSPKDFQTFASTQTVEHAIIANNKKKIYGVMFHPEMTHTENGLQILKNFIFEICQIKPTISFEKINLIKKYIKEKIGQEKAVCALSGGIDSTVAAYLTYQVIGKNLTCFYVDSGLMRERETEEVKINLKEKLDLPLKIINGKKEFLKALKGVVDPEKKRKIIGKTFIHLFEKEAKKVGAKILIQGTIYPDVIESKGTKHAKKIKTHHNVGGLPKKHGFKIVEPLRELYKDEVREIARQLKFPNEIINRHVFPGPGLAIRIIGEVTEKKLKILRKADKIVVDEIKKANLYDKFWMAFAIFTGIKTTGVVGDERKYGETIAIRIIESKDAMTADWGRVPYELLARISSRITTEVFEVVRVVYDITTKPPSTMEWE